MSPKSNDREMDMPQECVVELKSNGNSTSSHNLMISTSTPTIGTVINCHRFSKLHKLLRVTVYVWKFVLRFKSLTRRNYSIDWTITAQDLDKAEMAWVLDCQQHLMKEARFELWMSRLQLFSNQQDVWRCGGQQIFGTTKGTRSC